MIFFTSDLHFGHGNMIRSGQRSFKTVEEMDRVCIQNWNCRVGPDDDIYILGDFSMRGPHYALEILKQLNGRKYLVRGNHDQFVDRASFDQSAFVWIKDYHKLLFQGRQIILFHYPIEEWDQSHHGSIHLHGHQHNQAQYNAENAKRGFLRYDVGVDANGMAPVSIEKIFVFFGLSREKVVSP